MPETTDAAITQKKNSLCAVLPVNAMKKKKVNSHAATATSFDRFMLYLSLIGFGFLIFVATSTFGIA